MELTTASHPSSNSGTTTVLPGKLFAVRSPVRTGSIGDRSPFADWKTLYFTSRTHLGSVNVKIAGIPVPVPRKAS